MTVEEKVREILDRYVDRDFSIWACLENRTKEEEIAAFEEEFGVMLPGEFREFCMTRWGGFYIEAKEEVWPRAELYTVAPHWTFLYGFYVYTLNKDCEDWMDLRIQAKEFLEQSEQELVPFLQVICEPDLYCFDKRGRVFRWDSMMDEVEEVDKSFLEVFEEEMRELKERKEEKKKQGTKE